VPATVEMVPLGHTRRMRWLPRSAIRSDPSAGSTAMETGLRIAAATARPPSPLNPEMSVPATVVMVPLGHTRRTR